MGMSDFRDRYGDQLKKAREAQKRRRFGLGSLGTMRRRPMHRAVAVGAMSLAVVAALTVLAFTGSVTKRPAGAPADVFNAKVPENEALENGTIPDIMRDLQVSSGQNVTVAQVKQMQAQAAAVEPAANGIG